MDPGISRGDRLGRACRVLSQELREVVAEYRAGLIIGPHHAHATVARAIRETVWGHRRSDTQLIWWM